MNQLDAKECPVCGLALSERPSRRDRPGDDLAYYTCRRCGQFGLTRRALINLGSWLDQAWDHKMIFSHVLRRMQIGEEWPLIGSQVAQRITETATLPNAQEQVDNFIRWLGDHHTGPGEPIRIANDTHGGIIGALTAHGYAFIVNGSEMEGLTRITQVSPTDATAVLTLAGWRRWDELRRGASSGMKAFMAMPYGDAVLDVIVNEYFRPAVAATGFSLVRLDDDSQAGLIDDRLRVEIQSSRFLIADVTHGNNGAYWEAGYAEGLRKPVIYTCERSEFERASHFDTNHHLHVLWTAEDLEGAAKRLENTIRATIPEARRADD